MTYNIDDKPRLLEVLLALKKGYETGDFTELFPYLAADCVWESQWVLAPRTGYDAVVEYFTDKGKAFIEDGTCFPRCTVVELVGNINLVKSDRVLIEDQKPVTSMFGLRYIPGKLCLFLRQKLDGERIGIIIDVTLADDGKVKRIDLCMPELFNFKPYNPD